MAGNTTFPPHLDARGCLIIQEKHTVEFPLYISELERFWVQYRSRLRHEHFVQALRDIPQGRGVWSGTCRAGNEFLVVEFFHAWGAILVCFAMDEDTIPQVRLAYEAVENHNEAESRKAIWKFFDQLDACFHATA